jgi:hypothetical protein
MPRIRSVKPEFWDDQKMAMISRDSRLVYIGIWNQSDDYGVCRANPIFLKNQIFPHEEISVKQFSGWLEELKMLKRIKPFSANGENYLYLPHFKDHQSIDRPSRIRYPSPPPRILGEIRGEGSTSPTRGLDEGSTSPTRGLDEGSMQEGRGRDIKEEEGGERAGPKKIPPSPLPSMPKGLEFKIQDDLKARLAEIRQLRRKVADKEFLKNSPASHKDLLCKLEQKGKKYRELIEDYS